MAIKSKLRFNQMKDHLAEIQTSVVKAGAPLTGNLANKGAEYDTQAAVAEIAGSAEASLVKMAKAAHFRFGSAGIGAGALEAGVAGVLAHHDLNDQVAEVLVKNAFGAIKEEAQTHISMSSLSANLEMYANQQANLTADVLDIRLRTETQDIDMSANRDILGAADTGKIYLNAKTTFKAESEGIASITSSLSNVEIFANNDLLGQMVSGSMIASGDFLIDAAKDARMEATNVAHVIDDAASRWLKVDSLAGKVELKDTVGHVEVLGSGSLQLFARDAGKVVKFDAEADRVAASWAQSFIPLSDDVDSWINYKAQFGEVSLMDAIYVASLGGTTTAADYVMEKTGAGWSVVAYGTFNTAVADPLVDKFDCNGISQAEAERQVNVYLNGQKLAYGAAMDYELTVTGTAGAEQFEISTLNITIEEGDILIVEVA